MKTPFQQQLTHFFKAARRIETALMVRIALSAALVIICMHIAAAHLWPMRWVIQSLRTTLILTLLLSTFMTLLRKPARLFLSTQKNKILEPSQEQSPLRSAMQLSVKPSDVADSDLKKSLIAAHVDTARAQFTKELADFKLKEAFKGAQKTTLYANVFSFVCVLIAALFFQSESKAVITSLLGRQVIQKTSSALIANVHARITPPAYTRQVTQEFDSARSDLKAFENSHIEISGILTRPADKAQVIIQTGEIVTKLELNLQSSSKISFTLPSSQDARYHLLIHTPAGELIEEAQWRTLTLIHDEPPQARLLAPTQDVEVQTDGEVALEFEAFDDIGLSEWGVQITVRGQTKAIELGKAADKKRVRGIYALQIAPLNLTDETGAEVQIIAQELGNKGSARTATSAVLHISIGSARKREKKLLEDVQALADKLVHLLADELENPFQKSPTYFAAARATDERALLLAQSAKETQLSASEAPARAQFLAAWHRAMQRTRAIYDAKKRADDAASAQSEALQKSAVQFLERTLLYIQDMRGAAQTETLKERTQELRTAYGELRKLVNRYRNERSPEIKHEIMAQIEKMRRNLEELEAQSAALSEHLPQDYLNREAMQRRETGSAFNTLQEAMRNGQMDEAQIALERMDNQLAALEASTDEAQSSGEGARYSALRKDLRDVTEELAANLSAQEQLSLKTEAAEKKAIDAWLARNKARTPQEAQSWLQSWLTQHQGEMGELMQDPALSSAQEKIAERLSSIKEKMRAISEQAPLFDDKTHQALSDAQVHAQRAQKALSGKRLHEAKMQQSEVALKMAEVLKVLKQSSARPHSMPMPVPMPGSDDIGSQQGIEADNKNKNITIPSRESFKTPELFRREVMEAMKRKKPEAIRKQADEFYEELIQ